MPELDSGATAWVLVSTALVLLMTPGVAFFYGGMVRMKSVLNMMMMSFGAMGLIAILWVLYGYSMAFGNDVGGGLLGDPTEFFGLAGITSESLSGSIPTFVFVMFQCMFAIITVALISGAIADRTKFGSWMIFAGIWATVVYFPVAHWVFAFSDDEGYTGGWIANNLGAIDFAGGTAVHINAGAAGLALALVLGKRIGFGKTPFRPHNLPFVMLGAALLWFGWFGFNAGSALAADGLAGVAFLNTVIATAASMLAWLVVEKVRDGHSTTFGAASGVVSGLVAITPACAAVGVAGAIAIGIAAGVFCALAVGLKYKWGYDDSLDVVGVHLVGGLVGTLMIGLVATDALVAESPLGLLYGGGAELLGKQAIAAGAVLAYSFILTLIIGFAIEKTIGFRCDKDDEINGVDLANHAETAYEFNDSSYGGSFANRSKSEDATDKEGVSV
jgi:Amt family ammonium transporter